MSSTDECFETNECNINSSVLKICYESNLFEKRTNFCDCSSWYGWEGENCDEPTSTSFYLRTVIIILALIQVFNVLTASKTIYLYLKYNKQGQPLLKLNIIFYVAVFVLCSSCCSLIVDSFRLTAAWSPDFFEQTTAESVFFDDTDEVVTKYWTLTLYLIIFSAIFLMFAALFIILSWIDVFEEVTELFHLHSFISRKVLKRVIITVSIIISFAFIIFSALNAPNEILIVYFIGAICLTFGYTIGYCRFKSMMKKLLKDIQGNQENEALRLVRNSWLINCFSFIGFIISTLISGYGLSVFEERLKIGGFNYFGIFADLQGSFGLLSVTYTSYYVYRINKNLIAKNHPNLNVGWTTPVTYSSNRGA